MTELTREQLFKALDGWEAYIPTFQGFSPEEQAAFLHRQGYASLADLLAHFIAWWERALPAIPRMLEDPDFRSPEVDMDTFNAAAVQRFSGIDEEVMIRSFFNLCAAWLDVVKNLPDEAFSSEKIRWRLHIELVGHLEEHAIVSSIS